MGGNKDKPEVEAIKQLQNRLDSLNRVDCTDARQVEFLEMSKKLDDLLLKQEIYWTQRSRVGEIIESSGGSRHLSTIPLKNFHPPLH